MTVDDELAGLGFKRPEAPYNVRIFGIPLSPDTNARYESDQAAYDQAKRELVKQKLNPFRGEQLGPIARMAGFDPAEIATPDQFTNRQVSEPSLVPNYRFQPNMSPDRGLSAPMGLKSRVDMIQAQGPPDIRTGSLDPSDNRWGYDYPVTPSTSYHPTQLQGPLTPQAQTPQLRTMPTTDGISQYVAREMGSPLQPPVQRPIGQFVESPGADVTYNKREVNLEAPATLPQQLLGMSALERESKWPSSRGNTQPNATQFKYNVIAERFGQPAADYWMANGTLPGGLKDQLLGARLDTTQKRGGLLEAQTEGQSTKNQYMGREYDDKHAESQSRNAHRAWQEQYGERGLALRERNAERTREAIANRDYIAIERLNEQRRWHDVIMSMAGAVDKAGLKTDEERDAYNKAFDILSNMDQRDPTPEEMSFMERWFGPKMRYNVTPRPPLKGGIETTKPTSAQGNTPPAQGQGSQPNTNPFSDAPPGKVAGQTLRKDGKDVATWDGQKWVPK